MGRVGLGELAQPEELGCSFMALLRQRPSRPSHPWTYSQPGRRGLPPPRASSQQRAKTWRYLSVPSSRHLSTQDDGKILSWATSPLKWRGATDLERRRSLPWSYPGQPGLPRCPASHRSRRARKEGGGKTRASPPWKYLMVTAGDPNGPP